MKSNVRENCSRNMDGIEMKTQEMWFCRELFSSEAYNKHWTLSSKAGEIECWNKQTAQSGNSRWGDNESGHVWRPCGTFGWSFPVEHGLLLLWDVQSPHHVSQRRLEQLNLILLHLNPLFQRGDPVCHLHTARCRGTVIYNTDKKTQIYGKAMLNKFYMLSSKFITVISKYQR